MSKKLCPQAAVNDVLGIEERFSRNGAPDRYNSGPATFVIVCVESVAYSVTGGQSAIDLILRGIEARCR